MATTALSQEDIRRWLSSPSSLGDHTEAEHTLYTIICAYYRKNGRFEVAGSDQYSTTTFSTFFREIEINNDTINPFDYPASLVQQEELEIERFILGDGDGNLNQFQPINCGDIQELFPGVLDIDKLLLIFNRGVGTLTSIPPVSPDNLFTLERNLTVADLYFLWEVVKMVTSDLVQEEDEGDEGEHRQQREQMSYFDPDAYPMMDQNHMTDTEMEEYMRRDQFAVSPEQTTNQPDVKGNKEYCSEGLEVLSSIMEREDCKMCEGDYLKLCNIFKELHS